jgi:Ca2+-binding EF-hand superfamily protein
MKSSKKSKSGLKSGIDEGMELNGVEINPLILDLMIRETFAMFDENNSGDIDKAEFSKLTDVLGLEINEKKQNDLMRELDKEGNGCIDYEEFVKLMSRFQFGNAETHLETAFNEYDKDMDGEVGLDDLLKVSEEMDDVPMTKSDAELMIAFFKYFSQEKINENDDDVRIEELNSVNITKKEFITTLTRINFLVNKSENINNQSQDPSKSKGSGFYETKSGFYTKSNINEKSIEESKTIGTKW